MYNADNELTGAAGSAAESYAYDANGNRTSAVNTNGSATYTTANGTTTGNNNQIANDGTNAYLYDADGNLIKSTSDADSSYIVYAYDEGNRLTSATSCSAEGSQTQKVTYSYDAFNNLIGRSIQEGAGTTVTNQEFAYDDPAHNGQMILAFQTTGSSTPTAANLTDRFLWGPAVDQLMADETTVGVTAAGTVEWALGDNQNTVRDVVQYKERKKGHH